MVNFYKLIPLVIIVVICIGLLAPMLISAKSTIAFSLGILVLLIQPLLIKGYFKLFFKKGSN